MEKAWDGGFNVTLTARNLVRHSWQASLRWNSKMRCSVLADSKVKNWQDLHIPVKDVIQDLLEGKTGLYCLNSSFISFLLPLENVM